MFSTFVSIELWGLVLKKEKVLIHAFLALEVLQLSHSTKKNLLEQIADKTKTPVATHALDPDTHPEVPKVASDIDAITSVTPQAEELKLKLKTSKQNAKRERHVL